MLRQRERGHRKERLPGDPQRLAAGGHDPEGGGAAQEAVGELGRLRHHVLAVVEHEEQLAAAEVVQDRGEKGTSRLLGEAERGGDRRCEIVRVGEHSQVDEPGAILQLAQELLCQLQGDARLADAARPGEGEQRRRCQQALRFGELRLATDEARQLARQVVGMRIHRPQRRELGRQVRDDRLEEPLLPGQVAEPMLPEVAERHPGRQLPGDQVMGRLRHEELPSVSGRADPCRPMDVDPDVAILPAACLSGVHPHPHGRCRTRGPLVAGNRALRLDPGGDRGPGAGEREVEAISCGIDLHPTPLRERVAQEPVVIGQQRGVLVAQSLQQRRRALDVGEQERDRSRRKDPRGRAIGRLAGHRNDSKGELGTAPKRGYYSGSYVRGVSRSNQRNRLQIITGGNGAEPFKAHQPSIWLELIRPGNNGASFRRDASLRPRPLRAWQGRRAG